MTTILYSRVSTQDQSCEPQLLELRAEAARRGLKEILEIADVGSGTKESRVGIDRVMAMVRAGHVECVIAVKLDRLARSMAHFTAMVREFNARRVALVVPGQSIDTSASNPAARFLINILASVAELERDLICERTRAGLAVARARGKVLGRPSPKMVGIDRATACAAWEADGKKNGYAGLASRLGGVGRMTAWRVWKQWSAAQSADLA